MTQQPLNAALRGAVDLSGLANKRPDAGGAAAGAPGAGGGGGSTGGMVVEVADAQAFSSLVSASVRYPVIIALYSASQPGTRTPVDELATAVRAQGGKIQLGAVDIDRVPEVAQAFAQLGQQVAQQGQLPPGTQVTTVAFLQGQPMPLPPLPDADAATQLVDELLKVAVANGIAGRVPDPGADEGAQDDAEGEGAEEAPLSPELQQAYDAIEAGDYAGAVTAYESALAKNPADEEARLGLGQVKLLQRTEGLDATAVRADAAADPSNLTLAIQVADLDVLGGHVEDAFSRLVDLVRTTSGDERNAVREHLVGLFDIVGASDPRVKKARTALMSALY